MKKTILSALVLLVSTGVVYATEHHSGHAAAMGGGGGSGGDCMKPHLTKFLPAHLSTVVPEAEFSFFALNVNKPEQISVTVKNIPVEISAEYKDPYFLVKGKLPASLSNTFARINIKVSAKSLHCEGESGWLVKIADKQ